jgi:hypothetical protein
MNKKLERVIIFAMILTLIVIGMNDKAKADNQKVLNLASSFDKRIRSATIYNGNTVVLQGHWPNPGPSFQADFVAGTWCREFDSSIQYIQLRNMAFKMVGGSSCR